MQPRRDPLFSAVYEGPEDLIPEGASAYLFGTFEQRSEHSAAWMERSRGVRFVQISEDDDRSHIRTDVEGSPRVGLRRLDQLRAFLSSLDVERIYIDYTGLSHHVWAPLIRVSLMEKVHVMAVYTEPEDYRFSLTPTEGEIFDLSERIEGIAPIPGFVRIGPPRSEDVVLVPLLGFEGVRFAHVLEQTQPLGANVFPIIGVPGFRAEDPFHTYVGNRVTLTQSESWRNVEYAVANCPFSLFHVLEDLHQSIAGSTLQIAPIGTKPHALGAILYAIANPDTVEIIYDHPKRKIHRTSGSARCHVYFVSDFMPGMRR